MQPELMQCMEVWGGNTVTEKWFELPGLYAWVYSRPHGDSLGGGDVHYISSCASGRITRLLLADVSGHGESVSDVAIGLRELMRDHVNLIRQSKLVQAINREFTDANFHGKFATAVVGTYFSPRRSFEFCNAGHPPPLLYRVNSDTWTVLGRSRSNANESSPNFPLGIDSGTAYEQQTETLDHGDAILICSDALIESVSAEGTRLMADGFLGLVRSIGMGQPDTFVSRLVGTIRDMAPPNLDDDTTVILCQATDSKPSLKNNLLAPMRLFRRAADRTTLAMHESDADRSG